jgi:hypothetical protein
MSQVLIRVFFKFIASCFIWQKTVFMPHFCLLLLLLLTLQPWMDLDVFNNSTPLLSILCLKKEVLTTSHVTHSSHLTIIIFQHNCPSTLIHLVQLGKNLKFHFGTNRALAFAVIQNSYFHFLIMSNLLPPMCYIRGPNK